MVRDRSDPDGLGDAQQKKDISSLERNSDCSCTPALRPSMKLPREVSDRIQNLDRNSLVNSRGTQNEIPLQWHNCDCEFPGCGVHKGWSRTVTWNCSSILSTPGGHTAAVRASEGLEDCETLVTFEFVGGLKPANLLCFQIVARLFNV
jgi:hypothetical protein